MTGISIRDEAFAVRILEAARALHPKCNRVGFVNLCQSHGIRGFLQSFPELWMRITDSPPRQGIVPDQEYRLRGAAHGLKLAAFQERLFRVLEELNVPALAVKGSSLSQALYGDITAREFGDLDMLVPPDKIVQLVEELETRELQRSYPTKLKTGQQHAFFHYLKAQTLVETKTGNTLDLHWKLLSSWIGADLLPFEDLWSRSKTIEREGLTPWRSLSDEDNIVFLALHGFQDGWPKLKQFLDLCVALEVLNYNWDDVLSIASYRSVLVERAVELCVRIFGISHPGNMTHHYRDSQQAMDVWLQMATSEKTPQSKLLAPSYWSCPPSEAINRSFRALFCPAIDDIQSVEISPQFFRLYPLVRFFRLIRKAIERRGRGGL